MPINDLAKITSLLTIDFDKKPIVIEENKKHIVNGVLYLGNSTPLTPWKTPNYRSPWKNIPESHLKGCNFSFNLNIDPNIDGYSNTKKFQIPKVLLFLEKLKIESIINKYIIVYEWGKFGKKDGKLHFHGIIKTKQKNEFVNEICKEFNKKTNCRHRTITTKHFKDLNHRDTYISYLKKETQNKIKCLMWE